MPRRRGRHGLARALDSPSHEGGTITTISPFRLCTWLAALLALALLTGCASVTVSSISPAKYLAERRGDVLTTGRLSEAAQEVLRVAGIEECRTEPEPCRGKLGVAEGLSDEQRLSALAELWLEAALAAEQDPALAADALDAWLEAARHAYAYLFFTARRPGERAFEDRQTQVRDYYNYAVQQAVTRLFALYRHTPPAQRRETMGVGRWQVGSQAEEAALPRELLQARELLAASSLRFTGLRNTYRRDGFGASLVAVMAGGLRDDDQAFVESRFPAITALVNFPGTSLAQVLATRDARVMLHNPYRSAQTVLAGETVPLAANFTAGYGLWLARSGFSVQSVHTLFGLSAGIARPRIHMLQPYDPRRRVVVMLHGLASSPEAWINVANEVLGDETLRRNYQIWQVYYPSNAPLALNRKTIAEALQQTLAHFDPLGTAPASRDMVLVGHSMGGVLARLLLSSSGDDLWAALPPALAARRDLPRVRERLAPYISFEPLPQVSGAIFIAAPHQGTPVAGNRLVRRIANLVTLPVAMVEQFGDITGLFRLPGVEGTDGGALRIPNSIDNLRDTDPFVQAAAGLPISPRVRYHSIIGQADLGVPLAASSDGIVPYASAHLEGAASERVLTSGHSVQEHPLAMVEVRRILHERLRNVR